MHMLTNSQKQREIWSGINKQVHLTCTHQSPAIVMRAMAKKMMTTAHFNPSRKTFEISMHGGVVEEKLSRVPLTDALCSKGDIIQLSSSRRWRRRL